MSSLRACIVGNTGVGKSSLLSVFKGSPFPENPRPKLEEFPKTVTVDGVEHQLTCADTRSTETEERMRPLSYPSTDVFLICFSYTDPASLNSVTLQWVKELAHHCITPTPFFLVGLCNDAEKKVTEDDVKQVFQKHSDKLEQCFSVSAKTNDGVSALFDAVAKAAVKHQRADVPLGPPPPPQKQGNCCVIF